MMLIRLPREHKRMTLLRRVAATRCRSDKHAAFDTISSSPGGGHVTSNRRHDRHVRQMPSTGLNVLGDGHARIEPCHAASAGGASQCSTSFDAAESPPTPSPQQGLIRLRRQMSSGIMSPVTTHHSTSNTSFQSHTNVVCIECTVTTENVTPAARRQVECTSFEY